MLWLNMVGAGVTVMMGCLGLFLPGRAASLTGLTAATPEARAEFRGTLGITFILMGLVPILTANPYAFLTIGLAWLGAALGRLVSILIDQANTPKNWGAVAYEGVLAALVLAGAPLGLLLGA